MMKRLLLLALTILLPLVAMAEETVQVHQMMLGCADGYVVRAGGSTILIDAGRDTGDVPARVLDYLHLMGVEKVDVHIVTHYHTDHAGNLQEINAAFGHEGTVIYGPTETLPEEFAAITHGTYRPMVMGDSFSAGGAEFLCVGPVKLKKQGYDNTDSLNVLMTVGSRRMLFTGDYMPAEIIKTYREELRNVDVLKFPHHGMKPLCMPDWAIKHVNATHILIPGAVRMHVNNKTFDLNQNPKIYANGDGHVVVLTDGEQLEVRTQVPPEEALGLTI